MDCSVQREDLRKALSLAQSITEKKAITPQISHVLLEICNNQMTVKSHDLEIGMTSLVPLCSMKKEFKAAVSSSHIYEIVKALPDKQIGFKMQENGRLYIKSGSVNYSMNVLPFEQMTFIDDKILHRLPSISSDILNQILDSVIFSMSTDHTRWNINALKFEISELGYRVVSTDGHRLSVIDKSVDMEKYDHHEVTEFLVPRKGALALKKLVKGAKSENVSISMGEKNLFYSLTKDTLTMMPVSADYPDYKQVIPENAKDSIYIKLDRKLFADSIKRMGILSSGDHVGVKFMLNDDEFTLLCADSGNGDAKETIEGEFIGSNLSVAFNCKYLNEYLNITNTEMIEFTILDSRSPGVFKAVGYEGYTHYIMPMML